MRRLFTALALVAIAAPSAAAESTPLAKKKGDRPFWSWVISPHQAEISTVLSKVAENRQHARSAGHWDNYLDTRKRALGDALGMLRYALRLTPDDPTLIKALAEVAAERGMLDLAAESFRRYLDAQTDDDHARGTLGLVYAEQGRYGEAIPMLRAGLATSTEVLHTLAQVYMERGRVTEAIDLLVHQQSHDDVNRLLALAVAYDRDEQVGEAAEALSKLGAMFRSGRHVTVTATTFTPAVDQHYYAAMLYESLNRLDDARRSWRAYADALPAPRFRARALAHIAAIDKLGGRR